MSYYQSYSKTDEVALLSKITGRCVLEFLRGEMDKMGLSIVKRETIMLDDSPYSSYEGERITLSDGRIIEHKLERSISSDDSGHCHYAWYEASEIPKLKKERIDYLPESQNEDDASTWQGSK